MFDESAQLEDDARAPRARSARRRRGPRGAGRRDPGRARRSPAPATRAAGSGPAGRAAAASGASCCDLEVARGLDQRDPLVARVADARSLGPQLGRDQEAEREQRDAEGDLPARDRSRAGGASRRGHASARRRADDAGRAGRASRRRGAPDDRERADGRSGAGRRSTDPLGPARPAGHDVRGVGATGAPAAGPAGRQRSRRARLRPDGRRRGFAPRSASQPASNAGDVLADPGLERLVVGDPAGVRADELDQGLLAVRPDEVVDRRDALAVGQDELVAGRRELAGETVERDDPVRPRPRSDRASPAVRVALGQVDGETLVEPARREVVRVLDRRVEDEVGQLVGDDRARPSVASISSG